MDTNSTGLNITLVQVIEILNATTNEAVVSVNNSATITDLYEEYRMREKNRLFVYRSIAYVLGVLIVVSNLSVVVSSGLILKKGQKPKSTYLLLGNVSLADTIVGFGIIHGISNSEYTLSSTALCIFQMGMLVCPAMVSIFSVGLIAIDRYIYIVHGLYYQRWFNTTRVRIGIVLIWMISIILGFMPATGWVNRELNMTRCYYFALFPGPLVLINSILSIIPITIVVVLYTIILIKALKTVKTINNNTIKVKTVKNADIEPKLRINRRTVNVKRLNNEAENKVNTIKRSASFNFGTSHKPSYKFKSKSIEDLTSDLTHKTIDKANMRRVNDNRSKIHFESDLSVCTVESTASIRTLSINSTINQPHELVVSTMNQVKSRKIREPNKWRAIKVVMLTSGSIIFTWLPFFITVMFFVFCEDKLTNPRCIRLRATLGGPLAILAFINSTLNPIIYAWWHKGFKKTVMSYYRQCLQKCICHVVR